MLRAHRTGAPGVGGDGRGGIGGGRRRRNGQLTGRPRPGRQSLMCLLLYTVTPLLLFAHVSGPHVLSAAHCAPVGRHCGFKGILTPSQSQCRSGREGTEGVASRALGTRHRQTRCCY